MMHDPIALRIHMVANGHNGRCLQHAMILAEDVAVAEKQRDDLKVELDRVLEFETTCPTHGPKQLTTCVACRWDANERAARAERERDLLRRLLKRAQRFVVDAGKLDGLEEEIEAALKETE